MKIDNSIALPAGTNEVSTNNLSFGESRIIKEIIKSKHKDLVGLREKLTSHNVTDKTYDSINTLIRQYNSIIKKMEKIEGIDK